VHFQIIFFHKEVKESVLESWDTGQYKCPL